MKKIICLIIIIFFSSLGYAQNPSIVVDGGLVENATDLDAKAYYPKYDINDHLCALIKVSLTNRVKNPLTLEVGGLGIVAREDKENGEIWFYVPAQVKNLTFKCFEYTTPSPIPVILKEGTVYTLKLISEIWPEVTNTSSGEVNYLRMIINEPNVEVSLGRSEKYEIATKSVADGFYAEMLDYGTYYYKIEKKLYGTVTGVIEIGPSTPRLDIQLTPSFGYLDVNTSMSGADLYIDGKYVGKTPYSAAEPMQGGEIEVYVEMPLGITDSRQVTIPSDGSRAIVEFEAQSYYVNATLSCADKEAEIWVDNELKGKGEWVSIFPKHTNHIVEARRDNHSSTPVHLRFEEFDINYSIVEPTPLYGVLSISTIPSDFNVIIDGKRVGRTPYFGNVAIGEHNVSLERQDYFPESFSVSITQNETTVLSKDMTNSLEDVYIVVDQPPHYNRNSLLDFKGWIEKRLQGPKTAQVVETTQAVVSFIVERDGSLSNIKFIQSPGPKYEEQIRNVMATSPRWTAGKLDGVHVRVMCTTPIEVPI